MKTRKHVWWVVLLLVAAALAILAGYYLGKDKGTDKKNVILEKEAPIQKEKAPLTVKETVPKEEAAEGVAEEAAEGVELEPQISAKKKDDCVILEEQVHEFFDYLDQQSYIQQLNEGVNTYERYKILIRKLSAPSNFPAPTGEGRNPELIKKNIFFFFRLLRKNDIRMIKEILKNEEDTLEINLDVFYRWLMLGDRCPNQEGIRPSLDVLYHYAGFFTNTIGGRAYLFRRPTKLRLLFSYYCLLIIHETDRLGKNPLGIDIAPEIDPLIKDISINPDLQFQGDYLEHLMDIQEYYRNKR
jgi:hypothetical protein